MRARHQGTVLVANPSADRYGSDLQMRETVAGLRERGWRVVVAVPERGPLVASLLGLGAEVRPLGFPVLRRSAASATGVAGLAVSAARAVPRLRSVIREERADLVYVNTVTLPWWLLATRGTGVPTLCHVHEAEAADPSLVRRALAAPLLLADSVVVNSRTTEETVHESVPGLRRRTRLVHNGVAGPPGVPSVSARARGEGGRWRLVVVGRVSVRKAPDVALEATAVLRSRGHDVELVVCGTPGPGQEQYAETLLERSHRPDLRGAVRFAGYVAPVWPVLERADILLAPSLGESFGNAVVEAQLARRAVVATAVQGHVETVEDGATGLLVAPRDPEAMAVAVERMLEDPALAHRLADAGQQSAQARFGSSHYRQVMSGLVTELVTGVAGPTAEDEVEASGVPERSRATGAQA